MPEGSALARTPIEIWEFILDEVIRPGVALDASCTLESFREFRRLGGDGYPESERQRLVLRRVCKTWKQFAEKRSHRRLGPRSPLELLPPSSILHATRVHYTTEQFSKYLTQNTRWKVVQLDITDKEPNLLSRLAENAAFHPHIQRLVIALQFTRTRTFHITDLSCFCQLTYLVIRRHNDPKSVSWDDSTTQNETKITLPHLEVLDFQCTGYHTSFPSESVHLPSLRHLSLWIPDNERLLDTITPYAPTLRSLMVRYSCINFHLPPLFSLLPNVEELAVKGRIIADDVPPSSSSNHHHPLKRFIVLSRAVDFLEIRKLIERLPPVRLIFSKLEWPTSAKTKGRAPDLETLGGARFVGEQAMHKMKELAALCESRGIRLEDDCGRTLLAEAEVIDVTKVDDASICDSTAE